MLRFAIIAACAFAIVQCGTPKRRAKVSDNAPSSGGHFETIAIIEDGHGHGGGKEFSAGTGLKTIAQGSAEQATNAVVHQHSAAKQAAFAAKSSLAQAAIGAAATAQAALIGKHLLVQKLEHDANRAHEQVEEELSQLEYAQRAASASQATAHQASQLIHPLTAALTIAQSTASHAQQAAEAAHAELGSQQGMVAAAKHRLSALSEKLHSAQADLHATEAAAQQAQSAAHIAQSNAAEAAESASAASLESHHGGGFESGGGDHGFSDGIGGYH